MWKGSRSTDKSLALLTYGNLDVGSSKNYYISYWNRIESEGLPAGSFRDQTDILEIEDRKGSERIWKALLCKAHRVPLQTSIRKSGSTIQIGYLDHCVSSIEIDMRS